MSGLALVDGVQDRLPYLCMAFTRRNTKWNSKGPSKAMKGSSGGVHTQESTSSIGSKGSKPHLELCNWFLDKGVKRGHVLLEVRRICIAWTSIYYSDLRHQEKLILSILALSNSIVALLPEFQAIIHILTVRAIRVDGYQSYRSGGIQGWPILSERPYCSQQRQNGRRVWSASDGAIWEVDA